MEGKWTSIKILFAKAAELQEAGRSPPRRMDFTIQPARPRRNSALPRPFVKDPARDIAGTMARPVSGEWKVQSNLTSLRSLKNSGLSIAITVTS